MAEFGGQKWHDEQKRNAQRPCSVAGCKNMRYGALSEYCMMHRDRYRRWGSPSGNKIAKRWYARDVQLTHQLLSMNPTWPALLAAQAVVENWFYEAEHRWQTGAPGKAMQYKVPARRWILAMIAAGVTERQLLEQLAGGHLYIARQELGDTPKHKVLLYGAVAGHVIHSRVRDASGKVLYRVSDRKQAGHFVIDRLMPFLVGVQLGAERMKQAIEKRQEALSIPMFAGEDDVDVLIKALAPPPPEPEQPNPFTPKRSKL